MPFKPTYSPVVPLPSFEDAAGLAKAKGCTSAEAIGLLHAARERVLHQQKTNPLIHGCEPPIWKICDALIGQPWVEDEKAAAIRAALGFHQPVRLLLILGGNRSGKTQYGIRTMLRTMYHKEKARIWTFHMSAQQSVEYHHSLSWQYLAPEHRRNAKTGVVEYISYNQKQGFSFNKFVLENGSEASFRFYTQDRSEAIEGGEPDAFFCDELVPGDWIETLEMRVATRSGFGIIGFTPLDGYSPAVRLFYDGSAVVRHTTGWLLPKDNGAINDAAALGLTEEALAKYQAAIAAKREPIVPPSRPEAFGDLFGQAEPASPEVRKYEAVPRILKCKDPQKAIVHFHSSDNPFGNPPEVIAKIRYKTRRDIRERFYGIAEKNIATRFSIFNPKVHVIDPKDIPADGTNYHIVDPCSGRAFSMIWVRATPEASYVYREWPGNYYVPGVGIPEPWAEPSGDGKRMDGRPGRGQISPGWGLLGYKQEIARIEKWRDHEIWESGRGPEAWKTLPITEVVKSWNQHATAREKIYERFMDSRFGNTKSFDEGGMITLIEAFDEIGLTFSDAATGGEGWTIREGEMHIEAALSYDSAKPVDFFNKPKLYISSDCQNVIFALQIYTGHDGQKGAVKDFIDVLRYYFLKGCGHVDARPVVQANQRTGGCY